MHFTTSLTVSESKRLIAKGVVRTAAVRNALENGLLVVCPGTTNGYVAEELLGKALDKRGYVTGRTLPSGYEGPTCKKQIADIVLRNGKPVDLDTADALREMGPGDVFLKGANAINYDEDQVGLLIGHPTGGTLGAAIGTIVAKRILMIHPVGLEKSVPGDLRDAAAAMKESGGRGPTLWVSPGLVFTELEALAVLADVEAAPIGAGGIGGAEGSVWLSIHGEEKQLELAEKVLDSVRGEPPFLS
jgi:hypothetical protein